MITQKEVVYQVMLDAGSITQKDALEWGITRLAAVIAQLKKDGIGIVTQNETTKTMFGHATYARYRLE